MYLQKKNKMCILSIQIVHSHKKPHLKVIDGPLLRIWSLCRYLSNNTRKHSVMSWLSIRH